MGSIIALIDVLLAFIGTNITDFFIKAPKEERKEKFDRFIEPIYLELKILNEYYLDLFFKIRNDIENKNSNFSETLNTLDLEIRFKGSSRRELEEQIQVLLKMNEKNYKITKNTSLKAFLTSIYYYLTCPKSAVFFKYRDIENAADFLNASNNQTVEPFKIGIVTLAPGNLLYLSSVINHNEMKDCSSARHMLQRLINKLNGRSSKILFLCSFNKVAKREILEAIDFMTDELNDNYKKAIQAYNELKQELFF